MNVRIKKALLLSARIAGAIAAFAVAGLVLYRFEYLQQWTQIDNFVGAIPVALALLFAGGGAALCLLSYQRATTPIAVVLAALVLLSAALFPLALRGNWWIHYGGSSSEGDRPDLTLYAPFAEGSLAATLEEESALRLSALPVLDGATALYPVYAAFAQAVCDEDTFSPDRVRCSNTAGAYAAILTGEADVIFVAGPSQGQLAAAEEAGVELCFTPVGREAFVFVAGKSNPVESLTIQQIRNIYSGKTARWSTLGWAEGGEIVAFQRPEGSGSQTGLQHVMGDMPVVAPQPLPDASLAGSNSLMRQVSVWWKGVQPALGYSYRYYAQTMFANPEAKLLSVGGVAPSDENIRSGAYPFVSEFYAVTRGQPQGDAARLIEWILSPQGQSLVEKTGYAPVKG